MNVMRRVLAILLLTVVGLPLLPAALAAAQGAGAGLPACCRRTGEHQCGMTMGERALAAVQTQAPAWKAVLERCPYCPACVVQAHFGASVLPPSRNVALLQSDGNPLRVREAECSRRVARDGARQKRGPPLTLLGLIVV